MAQDSSQLGGDGGELVHTLSKENLGSPDASELGSPRCTQHFDLFNMVLSYKRMVLFLEPLSDAVELTRFLLGCVLGLSECSSCVGNSIYIIPAYHFSWKMPVCSLLVCVFFNVFFCTIDKGEFTNIACTSIACFKGTFLYLLTIALCVCQWVGSQWVWYCCQYLLPWVTCRTGVEAGPLKLSSRRGITTLYIAETCRQFISPNKMPCSKLKTCINGL